MKQFLIILGMIVAIDAWSKDLYVCSVTRFYGGGAEVTPGVEYKELHTFIFKKGVENEVQVLTLLDHNKRLTLTKHAQLKISKDGTDIDFIDPEEDIYGSFDLYEENKYFGKITVNADFTYNLYCLKQI